MSFEADFYLRNEFDKHLSSRLKENQLSVGGLFRAIFTIRECDLAVSFPLRIIGLTRPLNGVIEYSVLTKDLQPATPGIAGNMADGLITSPIRVDPIGASGEGIVVGYRDSFDEDLEEAEVFSSTLSTC